MSFKLTLKEVYLHEISKDESNSYYKDVRRREPEMFTELERLAQAILRYNDGDMSPTELSKKFTMYLTKHPETNPIYTGDTMGVKMFLDVLAGDSEKAGSAKRFYDSVFNAILKKRYSNA